MTDAPPRPNGGAPPPATAMILEVIEGVHCGARFVFDRHDTFVVGRADTAHFQLADDPYFSRHHFLLEFHPPRCYLRDLGSCNGTLVNGARVQEAFLQNGDVIGGGKTRLRLTIPAGPAEPTAGGAADTLAATGPFAESPTPPASQAGPPPPADEPLHPLSVPGYVLLRELGRGGMGFVYQARRLATGEVVALKMIVPESAAHDRAVQMFLREVSVLSRLDHPRIVRFHEVGMARGRFFFAMEYVPTIDLDAWLAPKPRPRAVRAVCRLLCQILEALAYAHGQSFVHRDVKPRNMLVGRTGRKVGAKLADFGLAKNIEQGGFSGITRRGDIRGSLPFMAPEQILNCRAARPAIDIYGAGATLYFLLARHTPHDFAPGRDGLAIVLDEKPVPLRDRCPDLPPGLAALVDQALAHEPQQRFASAEAMRRRLMHYAKGRIDR